MHKRAGKKVLSVEHYSEGKLLGLENEEDMQRLSRCDGIAFVLLTPNMRQETFFVQILIEEHREISDQSQCQL